MTEMMKDFTLSEDKLNAVNGGAFSDMETNALIVAEGMLSSPGGRTRWQTMSREDKLAKLKDPGHGRRFRSGCGCRYDR